MRPVGQVSFVNFGKPVLDNVRNRNDIHYFDVLDDFYWSTHMNAISFGDPRNTQNIYAYEDQYTAPLKGGSGMYTIFDTGSSDIHISSIYFKSIINKIFEKVNGKEWV